MQAIVYKKYGTADVLECQTVPLPTIKKGFVRIQNEFSSINPIDWKIRAGQLRPLSGITPPQRCGSDVAGTVIELGTGVTRFNLGDRVYGFVNPIGGGAFAEQVCVSEKKLALIPDSLTFEQAAVIPLAGLTAYDALTRVSAVQSGECVLINGCAGGVGVMAVQIAKILGAYVIGVCSAGNRALALSIGVDEVVDYQQHPALDPVDSVDVFFDVVSNRSFSAMRFLLSERGRYVNTLPNPKGLLLNPLLNLFHRQQSKTVMVKSSGAALSRLNVWIDAGNLKPIIESTYSMSDMARAQNKSEAGHVKGKLAIQIGANSC